MRRDAVGRALAAQGIVVSAGNSLPRLGCGRRCVYVGSGCPGYLNPGAWL